MITAEIFTWTAEHQAAPRATQRPGPRCHGQVATLGHSRLRNPLGRCLGGSHYSGAGERWESWHRCGMMWTTHIIFLGTPSFFHIYGSLQEGMLFSLCIWWRSHLDSVVKHCPSVRIASISRFGSRVCRGDRIRSPCFVWSSSDSYSLFLWQWSTTNKAPKN